MSLYRDFADQADIDAKYDISLVESNFMELVGEQFELSAKVRGREGAHLDVRYGPTLDEYLDIFPAENPNAPVQVFLHGGYWSMPMTAENFAGVSRGPVAHGVTTVVVNYSLAPKVTLDEITRQTRAALVWLHHNIASYGGDPNRIFVTGHSAGGQLVGMVALTDWEKEYGLPADLIKGGVSLSGLFDLRPFPYSWLAPKLLLTTETINRQSALFNIRPVPVPLILTLGGLETSEFHRQSSEFLAAWTAAGNTGTYLDLPGETHLSVYATYADPDSPLTRATVELINRPQG